ncbi:MAG: hypothetical protein QOD46_832 [Actinomycetota bacterium]|nr:hypothetical protein [Actinomycetota bacterium]
MAWASVVPELCFFNSLTTYPLIDEYISRVRWRPWHRSERSLFNRRPGCFPRRRLVKMGRGLGPAAVRAHLPGSAQPSLLL